MTYELAKQLKDAGFPEITKIAALLNLRRYSSMEGEPVSYPFLQELIEETKPLLKEGKWTKDLVIYCRPEIGWFAVAVFDADQVWGYLEPDKASITPEEAVAKLWLAINEKLNEKEKEDLL